MRIGLIVNPVSGMGGRVGLKGTDSPEILARARELGADPISPVRAADALEAVDRPSGLELLAAPGDMGASVAKACGFEPCVVGTVDRDETTPADTIRLAQTLVERDSELLVFVGGDGTARDVHDAIGTSVPVIGVPAGVKIYSAVFAPTPKAAGELLSLVLAGEANDPQLREVMDVDEAAYRDNRLSATLHGYLPVPQQRRLVQNPKSRPAADERAAKSAIATEIVAEMDDDRLYLLGPGTTTKAIAAQLDVPHTLLGVDAVSGGELAGKDLNERDLLRLVDGERATIVVGVVGGQGFIFGRGNQQFSPAVIEQAEDIVIVATEEKLLSLDDGPLLVDTGDRKLDRSLSGHTSVVTGVRNRMVVPITSR